MYRITCLKTNISDWQSSSWEASQVPRDRILYHQAHIAYKRVERRAMREQRADHSGTAGFLPDLSHILSEFVLGLHKVFELVAIEASQSIHHGQLPTLVGNLKDFVHKVPENRVHEYDSDILLHRSEESLVRVLEVTDHLRSGAIPNETHEDLSAPGPQLIWELHINNLVANVLQSLSSLLKCSLSGFRDSHKRREGQHAYLDRRLVSHLLASLLPPPTEWWNLRVSQVYLVVR